MVYGKSRWSTLGVARGTASSRSTAKDLVSTVSPQPVPMRESFRASGAPVFRTRTFMPFRTTGSSPLPCKVTSMYWSRAETAPSSPTPPGPLGSSVPRASPSGVAAGPAPLRLCLSPSPSPLPFTARAAAPSPTTAATATARTRARRLRDEDSAGEAARPVPVAAPVQGGRTHVKPRRSRKISHVPGPRRSAAPARFRSTVGTEGGEAGTGHSARARKPAMINAETLQKTRE